MVRLLALNIALILVVPSVCAQNEFVELYIEPKTAEVRQEIVVTIRTNIEGDINMNLPDEFLQTGSRSSGISSSVEIIKGKTKIVRYNEQSFAGYFEEEGKFVMGPVEIHTRDKKYSSSTHTVRVVEPQNMISSDPGDNMNQPIFGIIQLSKKEIYEGEPIVVEGKIYSQIRLLQIEDFKPVSFNSTTETHNLDNKNHISTEFEVVSGKKVQSFRIGKQVVFPSELGEFEIKPFQSVIVYDSPRSFFPERTQVVSNQTSILVKPLPNGAPKEFIEGVGEFKLDASVSRENIKQGEVIELSVVISGTGNIQNIKNPQIELSKQMTLYGDPEIKEEITYCTLGGEGSKTFTYFIQVNSEGETKLQPIRIAYFDPDKEKYVVLEKKLPNIYVEPVAGHQQIVSSGDIEKDGYLTEMKPLITYKSGKTGSGFLSIWGSTALIISPIMFGLLFGALAIKRKVNAEEKERVMESEQQKKNAILSLISLDENKSFYEKVDTIYSVLFDFLSHQLDVDKGNISRSYLREVTTSKISQTQADNIIQIMNDLDVARYSGIEGNIDLQDLVNRTNEIINSFGQ
ncbi:MAG: BatD family protein [Brumimicrobium sp.]